jgi:hypothetical protein
VWDERGSADSEVGEKFVLQFAWFVMYKILFSVHMYAGPMGRPCTVFTFIQKHYNKKVKRNQMLSCTLQTVTNIDCSSAACAFKTKLMIVGKSFNTRCFQGVKAWDK